MKLVLLALVMGLTACQTFQKPGTPDMPTNSEVPTQESGGTPAVTSPVGTSTQLRLGIILGPGGGRTLAHVGVLKQLHEKKIPVRAVVGLEWGAVIGSIYGQKASHNEAEWQLSKIRDEKFRDQTDIREALKPLSAYLQGARAETSKLPFACPSLNLKKSQVFMLARGRLDQLLPYCASYPPVTSPYDSSISANRDITGAAEYLRSKGVNYILFVNVLSGVPAQDSVPWLELAYDLRKKWVGVDERLDIVIDQKSVRDYKLQTELIQLGFDQSATVVERLAQKSRETP